MLCACRCHIAPDAELAFTPAGVNVSNVIEAAVACSACQNAHTPALLHTQLPCQSPVPQRGVQVITPEGKRMAWEDYERKIQRPSGEWGQPQ